MAARIDLVFPKAAVVGDGIGDHTRALAGALTSQGSHVRVLAMAPSLSASEYTMVDAWPDGRLRRLVRLEELIEADPPDLLVLQFEQFSYGNRGFNPRLPALFSWLERRHPATLRVLYAHEAYTLPRSPGHATMWIYQKHQAVRLSRHADVVFHSSLRGYKFLARFNPESSILPVFSNISVQGPPIPPRRAYRLPPGALVVLVFGHIDASRRELIGRAIESIFQRCPNALLVYIGKDPVGAASLVADESRLRIFAAASVETVSALMSHADLALAPFSDGVSARRGSFTALMMHSVPTVTTRGRFTDHYLLRAAASGAFAVTESNSLAFAAAATSIASDENVRSRMRNEATRLAASLPTPEATANVLLNLLHR